MTKRFELRDRTSVRTFASGMLVLAPTTAIGLGLAQLHPKHWLVQALWNGFIATTGASRPVVGALVENAMYGAWLCWAAMTCVVSATLLWRETSIWPARCLLGAFASVLLTVCLGAYANEQLAFGNTTRISPWLMWRISQVALVGWLAASLHIAWLLSRSASHPT